MTDTSKTYASLLTSAIEARKQAYAPYSGYRVGAALLGADGHVYIGCNVENAGYSPTICAERAAICRAISEGAREFVAIAVVGGTGESLDPTCTPCGVCRQVLSEFCPPPTPVILGTPDCLRVLTLGDLLPFAFSAQNL